MNITGLQQELQLFLAKVRVDQRQCRDVKGKIPGGVPGIFPFVRHRNQVRVVHVSPTVVADGALVGLIRLNAVVLEPAADIIVKELLGPKHSGQGLTHDVRLVAIQ